MSPQESLLRGPTSRAARGWPRGTQAQPGTGRASGSKVAPAWPATSVKGDVSSAGQNFVCGKRAGTTGRPQQRRARSEPGLTPNATTSDWLPDVAPRAKTDKLLKGGSLHSPPLTGFFGEARAAAAAAAETGKRRVKAEACGREGHGRQSQQAARGVGGGFCKLHVRRHVLSQGRRTQPQPHVRV